MEKYFGRILLIAYTNLLIIIFIEIVSIGNNNNKYEYNIWEFGVSLKERRLKLLEKISKTVTRKHLEEKYLDVDTTRVLLKARGITTLAQYREWHILNDIKWAPRDPTSIPGYRGANHLFGTMHYHYTYSRTDEMVSYDELRRIIAPLRIQTMEKYEEWHSKLNSVERYFFPRKPAAYYRKLGTWGGSAEFLGKDVGINLREREEEVRYWVIYRRVGDANDVIWVRDFDSVSLRTLRDDRNFNPIAIYEFEQSLTNYLQIQLDVHSIPDDIDGSKGKRIINNLSPLLFELDTNLLKVRLSEI